MDKLKTSSGMLFIIFLFFFTFFSNSIFAEDPNLPDKKKLAAKKEKNAVVFQGSYVGDFWYGLAGNLDKHGNGSTLGLLDLQLNIDFNSLLNFDDTTGLIEVQNLHSQRPNLYIFSLQGFDNIEDNRVTTMTYLYQFWLQKKIGNAWSILGGFYDICSEFYITTASKYLILPTFSLGTELALTGLNGPSTYPATGAALRVKITPSPDIYVTTALFDAGTANPLDRINPHLPFSTGDGVLPIIEIGKLFLNNKGVKGKIAIGAWHYTHEFPLQLAPKGTPIIGLAANKGYYALLDYPLYTDPINTDRVIQGFIRAGATNDSINFYNRSVGIGFLVQGFIPGRPKDIISYGIAPAWASQNSINLFSGYPKSEWQNELTYVAVINQWLSLQPDLQYISFQSAQDPLFQNTWLVGMRFTALLG